MTAFDEPMATAHPDPRMEEVRSPSPLGVRKCRVCGCWEFDACLDAFFGACRWVEPDLCSGCDAPGETESAGVGVG